MDSALKTIWITGASSGIGHGLAEYYIQAGHRIILTARRTEPLEALKQMAPDRVYIIDADVAESGCESTLHESLNQMTSVIDTVILSAGNCEYIDIDQFSVEAFSRMTEVNYLGTLRCIQACLPMLKKSNKPHIVPISSASVYFGLPRASAYGGAKAALDYAMQSLALEFYSQNITVSVVNPGFVDTPLTQRNDFPMPWIWSTEKAVQHIVSGISKRKPRITFPKSLIATLWLMNNMPRSWSLKLGQRMVRKGEQT